MTQTFILPVPDGGHVTMTGPVGEHMVGPWRTGQFYEQAMLDDVRGMGLAGTFLDVGASIGNHAVWFARACGAKVIAVEPRSDAYELLRQNLGLNCDDADWVAYPCAAGDFHGKVSLRQMWEGSIGATRVVEPDEEKGTVPMVRLDDVLLLSDQVALIKIDVEGYEPQVLRGLAETIGRCKPVILAECIDSNPDAINRLLAPLGYARVPGVRWNHTATFMWKPLP